MRPTQPYPKSLTSLQHLTVTSLPEHFETMSFFTFDNNDRISNSSVTVSTPLHLLVTLGLCGLALLGKAFVAICHARAARDVAVGYAGPKEPLLPPLPVPTAAQPPPSRQPRGPQGACSAIAQWLESLVVTVEGCLDDSGNLRSRPEDVEEPEVPNVVTTLNDVAAQAPQVQLSKQKRKEKKQRHRQNKQARGFEQQSASTETFELLDERINGRSDAVPVMESMTVAKRDAWDDVPSEPDSLVPVTAADDEVSTIGEEPHKIGEDTTVTAGVAPTGQGSQLHGVNEPTTASIDPSKSETEIFPVGSLPRDSSSLRAMCLPQQSDPSYNVFTQLRGIAIAHRESHSQDFPNLPEEQKRKVFKVTMVHAMLKVIATSQMPQGVVDEQHGPVGEQTTRTPVDIEAESLETGNAAHEQLAETTPEERVIPLASSSLDSCAEAVQDPAIPVEPSTPGEYTGEIRDDKWKCGFSWSEDVEEEEERRRQEAHERRQREDVELRQLEALRRSPATLARLQQTLAPITEDDEEH